MKSKLSMFLAATAVATALVPATASAKRAPAPIVPSPDTSGSLLCLDSSQVCGPPVDLAL